MRILNYRLEFYLYFIFIFVRILVIKDNIFMKKWFLKFYDF